MSPSLLPFTSLKSYQLTNFTIKLSTKKKWKKCLTISRSWWRPAKNRCRSIKYRSAFMILTHGIWSKCQSEAANVNTVNASICELLFLSWWQLGTEVGNVLFAIKMPGNSWSTHSNLTSSKGWWKVTVFLLKLPSRSKEILFWKSKRKAITKKVTLQPKIKNQKRLWSHQKDRRLRNILRGP